MTTRPLSVLLLDDSDRLSLLVARCLAAAPGIRTHVATYDPRTMLRYSRHVSSCHTVSWETDDARLIEVLRGIIRLHRVDVLLPTSELAVRFVATYREILVNSCVCMATPSPDLFDAVVDKSRASDLMRLHAIPTPETLTFPSISEARLPDGVEYPVVVKPLRGSGGNRMRFVRNSRDLERLKESPDGAGSVLVQRFIPGYDIDCSVFCRDGEILAYTVQKGFLEHPVRFGPAVGIEFTHDAGALAVARGVMRSLRWNGIAHIDMRYDRERDRIVVLEINPRFWISIIGSLHAGVNFPHLACLAALGVPFSLPAYRSGPFLWRPQTAFRVGLRASLRPGSPFSGFGQTVIPYLLRDPLPELYSTLSRPRHFFRGDSDGHPSSL